MSRARKGSPKAKSPKAKKQKGAIAKSRGTAAPTLVIEAEAAESLAAESDSYMLPDCLDADAAPALKDTFLQKRGAPISVDAGQVRRLGAQSLQILIAAARTWQTDNQPYRLTNPSAEFLDTMALAGLSPEALLLEGPQS
jgi:chemotaxis protein CheX